MEQTLPLFVKQALEQGQSRDAIETALKQAGWDEPEIRKALQSYADIDFPIAVPRRLVYTSARETFLYLVMFMTLAISAVSVGIIVFQLINQWFPDPLTDYAGYTTYIQDTIRNAAAALIIAFPVFAWMHTLLARGARKNPELKLSRPKVVITYLTLFITSAFIIGDLIALVNGVLAGDLTMRFVLKVLTILIICGGIFWYYLSDLRAAENEKADM